MPALEKRARVSEQTLRHELEVMDVKAAFHTALKKSPTFSVVEFSTWPHLNQFDAVGPQIGGGDVTVKPDGFIRIHEKEADGGISVQRKPRHPSLKNMLLSGPLQIRRLCGTERRTPCRLQGLSVSSAHVVQDR
jgi:hypothetical protein